MRRLAVVLLVVALAGSVTLNWLLYQQASRVPHAVRFPNANSRDTSFTIHNVKAAHQYGTGHGVKVGIIDTDFGTEEHPHLYAGGVDFTGNPEALRTFSNHGYSMALVVREISPDCEIYALNALPRGDESEKVSAMIDAIDWAIENELNILTYSSSPISSDLRPDLDRAAARATEHGVVLAFIHYDHDDNLVISGMFPHHGQLAREPDLNILHYDYNTLFLQKYQQYMERTAPPDSGDDIPFFSMSSTSPVTAGFVAILMSIDSTLTPGQYRDLLIETSYSMSFEGEAPFERGLIPRIADIGRAAQYLHSSR